MVWALGVGIAFGGLAATRAGFCRVNSTGFSFHASTLRGVGRPTGGLNAELLCVLRVQPLPGEFHRLATSDAADGSSAEKAIQNIERNVPARGAPRDEA